MKEYIIKSFDFANSLTTQLITLSTVLIGLSITFTEKFEVQQGKIFLVISWVLLFISLLFGIFTLMAISGTIGKFNSETSGSDLSIYRNNITRPSTMQILFFILGVLSLIIYSTTFQFKTNAPEPNGVTIVKETSYKIIGTANRTDTLRP